MQLRFQRIREEASWVHAVGIELADGSGFWAAPQLWRPVPYWPRIDEISLRDGNA
jgi:hypothetical protein